MTFSTESFRAMPMHSRNARDVLHQRVLMRFGVNGGCLAAGK